ncbi:tyrosine-type recombinase/integrase [Pantoea agglomerans]|uniref:tyrosine-type recombinase/integrase n=1 Tax=Enterobacter agglomerans TaxID=549 RepID=UPI0006DD4E98|nr:site-specific integrase [Pantoea agglomerans]KPA06237.1 tyrosine recombinase XerD [Pantoea agglomerans]
MDRIVTNTIKMDTGERCCLITDKVSKVPLYYPCLYISTELRKKNESISTIELHSASIALFYRFLNFNKIDIEARIRTAEFLHLQEIDALKEFITNRMKKERVVNINSGCRVSSNTQYFRLTAITKYLEWLCDFFTVSYKRDHKLVDKFIAKMKSHRPKIRFRNQDSARDKNLNQNQLNILFEILKIGSEMNPFNTNVQRRNRLMILILYHLGLRAGELLNIRVTDIDIGSQTISINRRADDPNDSRIKQPLVKTLKRKLSISNDLCNEICNYIKIERRKHRMKKDNGYLFICHKKGNTFGEPLSIQAYHKIINALKNSCPELSRMTGHKLRHTWNYEFSSKMDQMENPPNQYEQEQMRSLLMGWKEGSGTASTYNRRFIENKAAELALNMQKDMIKRGGV